MKKEIKHKGLCFRCEYRARFLEFRHQPRCECGMVHSSVCSCYMYKPVAPLVLVKSDNKDKRPFLGPAFISSRASAVDIAEGDYCLAKTKKGTVVYFKPTEVVKNVKAKPTRNENKL